MITWVCAQIHRAFHHFLSSRPYYSRYWHTYASTHTCTPQNKHENIWSKTLFGLCFWFWVFFSTFVREWLIVDENLYRKHSDYTLAVVKNCFYVLFIRWNKEQTATTIGFFGENRKTCFIWRHWWWSSKRLRHLQHYVYCIQNGYSLCTTGQIRINKTNLMPFL